MTEPHPSIPEEDHPPREWQKARLESVDLALDKLSPAPGTHIFVSAEGVNHHTLVLLRASIRALERAGHKIKLL